MSTPITMFLTSDDEEVSPTICQQVVRRSVDAGTSITAVHYAFLCFPDRLAAKVLALVPKLHEFACALKEMDVALSHAAFADPSARH